MEQLNKRIIAERLKAHRGNRTREEVAEKLNISKSALQMYENAQRMPRDEIKIEIANFYGVTVQELFFDLPNHNKCSVENQVVS